MSSANLTGNISELEFTTLPTMKNAELYKMIGEPQGAPFTINYIKLLEGGTIETQDHPACHGVFILEGNCKVLLGEEWLSVQKGSYIYVPPEMVHAFANEGDTPVELVILKL